MSIADRQFSQGSGFTDRRLVVTNQPQKIRNRKVEIKVEDLTPSTFMQWTDSTKWLCVTGLHKIDRPEGVGRVIGDFDSIKDFISTYPHSVGTFFVVCAFDDFVDLAAENPTRDLRYLIVQ